MQQDICVSDVVMDSTFTVGEASETPGGGSQGGQGGDGGGEDPMS